MSDIENFLCNPGQSQGILLFPPVSKYRRFLIHKLIEESFSRRNLQTLSVGKDSGRRTAVFLRSLLRADFKPPENSPVQQPWRQKTKPLTAPMVNKNNDKNKARTPYGGIYRPPAVRRLLDTRSDPKSEPQDADAACEPQQQERASSQQEICTGDVVTSNKTQTQQLAATPPVLCSSEKKSARIKRPDQQVYVPRAKRLSTKDESLPITERTDKSNSQPHTKVFISEKRSCVKVRKKSDPDSGGTENSLEPLNQVESPVEEITTNLNSETSLLDLSSEISSVEPSFVSLDSSVFETSHILSESSELFDGSFQTCPEDSYSEAEKRCEENSPAIIIDLSDESLSDTQQCNDHVDKLSDFSSSPSLEPMRSSPEAREVDNMDESCESTDVKSSEISRLIVEDTDTPNSSLVSFSSDSGSLAILNESLDSSSARVMGVLDISAESEDKDSPMKRIIREKALAKSPEAVADDWELLLNESGQFLDSSLLKELEEAVGKVNISRPSCDYKEFQTVEERTSDGECIIEIYGFSSELRTHDLMNIFSPLCGKNFQIAWVDDTHALGVFPSPLMADELLSTELPFVRTRPLSEGIPESRFKARKLVLPPMTRPKTCPALARRLVTGALGLRLPTSKLEREAERKVLKEARDKKRQEAKIRKDIWEGN
ncbi:unnamed protein product [Bemisia tabaci]|uniref:R3H domain-containing protein n=2 Tax=Bemisia tabaci TaxID=7038 RepID=A0A9P0APP8_BEMTA|nr:unnamed protein product [Bemisia tabaci]